MRVNSMRTATASTPSPEHVDGRKPSCGRPLSAIAWWLGSALVLGGCADNGEEPAAPEEEDGQVVCERDESKGPETAERLAEENATEGFLCPLQDSDWYTLTVERDAPVVQVTLEMANNRSPVQPTYAIWESEDGEATTAVAGPPPESIGARVEGTHLLAPGQYFVAVRDQGDDEQDMRNRYKLTVGTVADPDADEPNDDMDSASTLDSGDEALGYIANAGDEDWHRIEVPDGSVVRIRLQMPAGGVQPRVRLVSEDGSQIVEDLNPMGATVDSNLSIVRVLSAGGTYFVVVSDDDGEDGDTETPYELYVEVLRDLDENEPNDHPAEATALAGAVVNCGPQWSDWMTASGSIASPGDNDWFAVQFSGCLGGLIEAELLVGDGLGDRRAWELQTEVQATLTLVREHGGTTCNDDEDCTALNIPCEVDPESLVAWECEGFFNSCLSEGLCAGATVCLPNGLCGANQTQRNHTATAIPSDINGPPDPPNAAVISAPILADGTHYLRASDFQADGGNPEGLYTLRVRVRRDPDPGDATTPPNNLYTPLLRNESLPVRESAGRYDAMQALSGCGDTAWEGGAISYENDLDFYQYPHPCPGADCMLEFHYEVDPGPVEPAVFIFRGGGLFTSFPIEAGTSGSFGGVGAGADECFYAFNRDEAYTVLIRDVADDGRQWSPDQGYRFCLQKVTDTCEAPCMYYEGDGCGQPQ